MLPLFAQAIFFAGLAIVAIVMLYAGVHLVKKYSSDLAKGKGFATLAIFAVVFVFLFTCIAIGGWKLTWTLAQSQSVKYQNQAEKEYLKEIESHESASSETLKEKKKELEKEVKDEHVEAKDAFEEAMRKEEEKIKKRNAETQEAK